VALGHLIEPVAVYMLDETSDSLSRREIALRVLPAVVAVALLVIGSWQRQPSTDPSCSARARGAESDRAMQRCTRGSYARFSHING
jgi:hypothetical protein